MDPFYFHAVNVILHCLVTLVLMYTCDKAVFRSRGLAFATALLFAVHPVHTEAVAGIVGRADVLACLLFLLAFLSYSRGLDQCGTGGRLPPSASPFFLLLSLVLGTCAMLVKETGVTVFGVCLVYDFFSLPHKQDKFQAAQRVVTFLHPSSFVHLFSTQPILSLDKNKAEMFSSPGSREGAGGDMSRNSNTGLGDSCENGRQERGTSDVETRPQGLHVLSAGTVPGAAPGPVISTATCLCHRSNGALHQRGPQRPGSLQLASPLAHPQRENGKQQIPHRGAWGGCHPGLPQEPKSSGIPVSPRAVWSLMRSLTASSDRNCLLTMRPFFKRAILVVSYVIIILYFRLWIMGGSMPLFSEQDNPASFSPYILTRSGVETLPHNAKVHYNYANFLKDQGRNREAIYHYRTALKLYPRHASALNNLGTLMRDTAEAKRYYQRALQLHPKHSRALFNLGNLLKSQEKKEEAVALLKESIKYGPEFADAYSSLASLLAEQERFKEAEEIYQAGIKNCPDSSDLHNNYGVFLVDSGSPEKAAAHYQQAVILSPHHHVAMVNLGRLYRSLGENDMAEEWYKRALQVAREAETLSPLGALYYNTGRYEEALQVYHEAVALQPLQRELRLALAQVLAVMGQTKEAEKMTEHIVSEGAECLECYRLLSAIYSKQQDHDKALHAIDKALQLKPKDPKVVSELFFTKGNQLREQNLLDKAFESYNAAVALNPEQAQAWMNMGGIQHIKGKYMSARAYYERALQLVPDSKLLKENLAKLDRLEKRLQEVREKDQT
ncbi:Transmembrane and TPR repeat-containing protein 1 [Heterocephalus glaber]|uniref:Transmembrane and TPR repeat-containing protein 1 n=1 Tax=Heterocephalus glaber TaxID=10181 RepID=G5BLL3_HETGA|nr:Transmembrane and TPR repeat-containing protein 1 [Heterocephalus glaber]